MPKIPQKWEKNQERALRFIYNDKKSTYKEILKQSNLLSLSALRIRFLGIEVFKCKNEMAPQYLNELFQSNNAGYNFRDSQKLIQPKFNTVRFGYKSFRYYGAKLWNALPVYVKESSSIFIFKRRITEWCSTPDCEKFYIE